ncbi:hypothetical protein [Halorarius halobius]|uniref:hypothetical protein n=1 Tax=Halorarius halobius TaxID=2962671 RepID=UPI0020CF0544|nr:hypothetical protein [Halorarius halobius]
MRYTALTLTVAVLLAAGGAGAATVSMTTSPQGALAAQTPAETASPANYTTEVIDPNDRLEPSDVDDARTLAWENRTVRHHVDAADSPHFHIEALDGDLQVYVARNETAPPRVVATVNLDAGSVSSVDPLGNVRTAGEETTVTLTSQRSSTVDDGTGVFRFDVASDERVLTADDSISRHVSPQNRTVVEDSGNGT